MKAGIITNTIPMVALMGLLSSVVCTPEVTVQATSELNNRSNIIAIMPTRRREFEKGYNFADSDDTLFNKLRDKADKKQLKKNKMKELQVNAFLSKVSVDEESLFEVFDIVVPVKTPKCKSKKFKR